MLPLRFVSQLPVKRLLLRLTHMTAWSELLLSDSSCKKPGRFSNSDSHRLSTTCPPVTSRCVICHLGTSSARPRHVLGRGTSRHLSGQHTHTSASSSSRRVSRNCHFWQRRPGFLLDPPVTTGTGEMTMVGGICPSSEMTVWREVKHVGSPSAGVSRWHPCGWTWGHYVGHRLVLVLASMWIRGNGVKHCEPHSRVVVID